MSKIESSGLNIVHRKETKQIVIDGRDGICSVAFLVDGKHVVSGGWEGKIRLWRVEDGKEVGVPMDVGSGIRNVVVSGDGRWFVCGTQGGLVQVWNAESHKKEIEFRGHTNFVCAVDVSADATRIATGSYDDTACVWSLSTGQRLLGPWKHDFYVVATKFSPDGHLLATATWKRDSLRIYDSHSGRFLVDFQIQASSLANKSLAWTSDGKQLFALSRDGKIHFLDVSTGTTLWHIHNLSDAHCIALACNGRLIVVVAGPSVSFWDATTREQIGPIIEHVHKVWAVAISANYDFVAGGEKAITLRNLSSALLSCYINCNNSQKENIAGFQKTIKDLQIQLAKAQQQADIFVQSLRAQEKSSSTNIARLENANQELRDELSRSQRVVNEQKDGLNQVIGSLRTDLHTQGTNLRNLVNTVQQLQSQFFTSQRTAKQERVGLQKAINSLRADLQVRDDQLAESRHKADSLIRIIHAHEQKHQCESLYAKGYIYNAAELLLEVVKTVGEDVKNDKVLMDWLVEFTQRCVATPERLEDEASTLEKRDEALAAYSAALSLDSSTPDPVLMKWVSTYLMGGSVGGALNAPTKLKLPKFIAYRAICDILERDGRLAEAVECFRKMQNESPGDLGNHDERAQWELEFSRRCVEKLVKLSDTARDAEKHDEAIGHYSVALSLNSTDYDTLVKRSNEIIELDPSVDITDSQEF